MWKKQGHNYKYLPRRHDGIKKYDFVAENAGPDNFPERVGSLFIISQTRPVFFSADEHYSVLLAKIRTCNNIFEFNVFVKILRVVFFSLMVIRQSYGWHGYIAI